MVFSEILDGAPSLDFFCGWESSNNNTIYVREYKFKQVIIKLRSALSGLSSLNFSLKRFLIFSPEKPTLKKFLIFFQKAFLFYRKRNFYWAFSELIFHESYIQNHPGIRELSYISWKVYLELDAYLQTWYIQAYSELFPALSSLSSQNIFIFRKAELSYISANGTF